jgi:hypothetical protein
MVVGEMALMSGPTKAAPERATGASSKDNLRDTANRQTEQIA